MNDGFRDLKERMRRLDAILENRGPIDLGFAQALSFLHRAARRGDRHREPSPELRGLLERAEECGRRLA
jgi:hypothetical protein